ncbi:hypothetical protein BJX70DRAFT_354737 [Aspergillus crustosus]
MPPKKVNAKRAKMADSATSGNPRRSARLSPNLGVSALPNIPTKQSFAYGGNETAILPHMMRPKAELDLHEMANTIEEAVQEAKERDDSASAHGTPNIGARRRKKSVSNSVSPPRRTQRQPTPDEVQLLQSLEESASPVRSNSVVSSIAPPTPVRRSFSTASASSRDAPAGQLYPRSLQKSPSPVRYMSPVASAHGPVASPNSPVGLGLDNASVISWNVERDVHDDELQRTRTNITAPPRRPSGFAMPHETIEEEDEPQYQSSRSPSVATYVGEAAARTIIPDRSYEEPPLEDYTEHNTEKDIPQERPHKPKKDYTWLARLAILMAFVLYAVYTFKYHPGPNPPYPGSHNSTGLDTLSNQVGNLGTQVSSLSKDVKSVKTELSKVATPTTIYQYPSRGRQETVRTNFLSIGHGVIVDPYMTSPSIGVERTWLQRFYMWLAGEKHVPTQPPLAALTSWEDFGECWCSAPRDGMSQIGILLGRRMIPEDVIVEHMPKAATLTPEVAPRKMELWVRYRYMGLDARPYRKTISSLLRWWPSNVSGQDPLAPDSKKLRKPVMEALRLAWSGEPDENFSDDELLGPHYYRVGQWTYDINDGNHVQKFPVTAMIDSDQVRVDKVVFRVKSNWGANETCIYRLKLHGRI